MFVLWWEANLQGQHQITLRYVCLNHINQGCQLSRFCRVTHAFNVSHYLIVIASASHMLFSEMSQSMRHD